MSRRRGLPKPRNTGRAASPRKSRRRALYVLLVIVLLVLPFAYQSLELPHSTYAFLFSWLILLLVVWGVVRVPQPQLVTTEARKRPVARFFEAFSLRQAGRRLVQPLNLLSVGYLAWLLVFAYRYLHQTLFRTWFFSSDEYVFAAEVIRFSNLDFHQHFFDMPGTPFMMLDTVVWRLVYAGASIGGFASEAGIGEFTFHRMSALFILMRATTLTFFLISAVLLFVLASKLFGKGAGAVAALLLVMSPIYTSYSSFVRVESLAMVLILSALLWLDRGIVDGADDSLRPPGLRDCTVVAGLLAGLAAGVRLHAMTAGVPVLVLTLWLRRPFAGKAYPGWILMGAKYALPATWAGALAVILVVRSSHTDWPAATHLVGVAAMGWIAVTSACLVGYLVPRVRPIVVRVMSPGLVKIFVGLCAGLLLGVPTIATQYGFFLGSIQMYSRYVEWDKLSWPVGKYMAWYLNHYLGIVAPDRIVFWLLCIGAVWILVARDRKALPYLIGAALFFVSKPLKMVAAPHHAILWLPFFFLVCAYPIGKAFDYLSGRLKYGEVWATAALGGFLCLCFFHLTLGPKEAVANAFSNESRMHNIESASGWIKANTEPGTPVAVSYFCFNPDVFYLWMRDLEVPVPAAVFDGRQYLIWWGHGSALRGRAGYACVTRSDIPGMKAQLDILQPGEGTDPYSDPRFKQVSAFGSGGSEVDLFRFDFR